MSTFAAGNTHAATTPTATTSKTTSTITTGSVASVPASATKTSSPSSASNLVTKTTTTDTPGMPVVHILKVTASSVLADINGYTTKRLKIYHDNLGAFIYPLGRYSGAPIIRA